MGFLLILASICLYITYISCLDVVPVIVWGSGSSLLDYEVPALKKLSTAEFHDGFVRQLSSKQIPAIGLFVKDSLSLEDLIPISSHSKYMYPILQSKLDSDNSVKFLPSVSNPMKAFNTLKKEANYDIIDHQNLPNSSNVIVIIPLKDTKDNDRLKMFEEQDSIIQDGCSRLHEKYGSVICVLTGIRPSWFDSPRIEFPFRKLLQASETTATTNTSMPIFYYYPGIALVYTKLPPIFSQNGATVELSKYNAATQVNSTAMSVRFITTDSVSIIFNFSSDNATWTLSMGIGTIGRNSINELLTTQSNIQASVGHSYHTPLNVTFSNGNYSIVFNGLQVQYQPSSLKFDAVEDEIGFFTIPIWSGLFVSSFLIAIILLGLSMIFDIKTMDQFDDPKGKTISINVSD